MWLLLSLWLHPPARARVFKARDAFPHLLVSRLAVKNDVIKLNNKKHSVQAGFCIGLGRHQGVRLHPCSSVSIWFGAGGSILARMVPPLTADSCDDCNKQLMHGMPSGELFFSQKKKLFSHAVSKWCYMNMWGSRSKWGISAKKGKKLPVFHIVKCLMVLSVQ